MTVAEATYSAKIGDTILPVTLTEACEWGGWFGVTDTGSKIRVTTARLIGPVSTTTVDTPTPIVKEPSTMSTVTSTAAKSARAARRANKPSITPTNNVTTTPKESTVSTIKINAKPAAKTTPKRTPKRKPAAKPAPVEAVVTLTQADLDAMVAKAVAEAVAGAVKAEASTTSKPAAKRSTSAKGVTVKLKLTKQTTNKVQFTYVGTDDKPLVTAVYVNMPLVATLAQDPAPVKVEFAAYTPRPTQKGQPKSKIRYSGTEDTISDLYVDRAAITKLGYTESKVPVVTVKVVSDDEITLTFPKA
jgi:hypothetical protein